MKKMKDGHQAGQMLQPVPMDALSHIIEMISKFQLCVLLTQFGKTFTTITRIVEDVEKDEELGRSLHFVWTMNTLLSNTQFSNRLRTIELKYGKGSVVVFASKYSGNYEHVKTLKALKGLVVDLHTCPRVIVMCSNDVRFKDGFDFINILNTNETNIKRVYAYYDELHQYINQEVRKQIEDIDSMHIVKRIMALTATPDHILQPPPSYWSRINVIKLDEFNDVNYIGSKDMKFNIINDFFPLEYRRPPPFDYDAHDRETIGFINHVLNNNTTLLSAGTRTFIPAHKRRVGHQSVRTEVFKRSPMAVVIVLNGEEKTLQYYIGEEKKSVDLTSPSEEVCRTIARIIREKSLKDRPIVITGFLCVGMGQTLIEETIGPFTHAIFSHMSLTNDEIYQLFGRCTARSKNWITFCQTNIYCPTKIMNRIIAMEECARNIATQHDGSSITINDYRAPLLAMGDMGMDVLENVRIKAEKKEKKIGPKPLEHPTPFNTKKEAEAFLTNMFKKPILVDSFVHPDNYWVTTRMPSYYHKKKNELTAENRLTKDFFNNIGIGANISKTQGSGQPYMVYPVYETLHSKPNEVKFYVRYLPPELQLAATA